jgi:hypothetical protein
MSVPSKEVLDAIAQGRETGYSIAIRDAVKACDALREDGADFDRETRLWNNCISKCQEAIKALMNEPQ